MTASHPPTEKLYLDDPYTVSFNATLLSCTKQEDGSFAAVLDRTFFYPESGGQLSDAGRIGDAAVARVWEDEGGIVYHGLGGPVGEGSVSCDVDWTRREEHMHHHTGQHILSRAFIDVGNLETISFHMGEDACTIDLKGPKISDAIARSAEALANSVIRENRAVTVRNVTRDRLGDEALRKKLPAGVEVARLVEVEGFDVVGCCGTHVRRTGELGLIKVLRTEKARGAHRVYFKVGRRAMEDYQKKHDVVQRLSNRFTTGAEEVEDKVEKLQDEARALRKEVKTLAKSLAEHEAVTLLDSAREHGGRRFVVAVLERDDEYIKSLASELRKKENTVSLLGGKTGRITCAASLDLDVDLCEAALECAERAGGSGGGKGGFAALQIPDGKDIGSVLEEIYETVRKLQMKEKR